MSLPTSKERPPLLPERRQLPDFFVCDVMDAAPKGDLASMEHPIFSLSSTPDRHVRRYQHGETYVEIQPSVDGLATVHDRDILIFCISQLMAAINDGQPVSTVIRFKAYDLLKATNRMTNGQGYEGLKSALTRLAGTRIETNIVTGGQEIFDNFGLINRATVVRQTRDGRMQEVEVELSKWIFNAIEQHEVLTIHRDYFRLRKPLERRIYEIGRKHCGTKSEWRISLGLLQKKCGSVSTEREFRRLVSAIVEEDRLHAHMPDYSVTLEPGDMVVFHNRGSVPKTVPMALPTPVYVPPLDPETYHVARMVAPGEDVYRLEGEWRQWITERPHAPDAAFLGFCRVRMEKRGLS